MEEALIHAADVEALIDAGESVHESAALLWVCHQVLRAAKKPRAKEILVRAHSLLTEGADRLDEADRETFLGGIPWHRAITTAWVESNAGIG